MAKESGLGARYFVDGYDLSNDTNSLGNISKVLNPILMTGIDKEAIERLAGQLTGEISWVSYFNPTNAHTALKGKPRTDRIGMYYHRAALGTPVAAMVAKQINYDPGRDNAGVLNFNIQMLSNAWWLDWCKALTAGRRVDTVDTNGTGVDFSAGASFGLQAYLEVFAISGGNAVFTLEQSSDNGVGDAWTPVTGGTFATVAAAPASERIQTARNQAVERYLRVVTTGTFTSVDFAVAAVINGADYTI